MGYGKDIYEKANEQLAIRRHRAFTDAEARRERITKELPGVDELEKRLRQSGVSAAKAVFAGGDTKTVLEGLRDENLKTQEELRQLLATKGYTPEDLEERYFCPECRDKGYVEGKMCGCLKKLLRDTAYGELNSRSPLPLESSSFQSFDLSYYKDSGASDSPTPYRQMERVYNFCKKYAEEFGAGSRSILMEGATGLGKTHLSLAIAREVIGKGFGVIYGSAPDLLSVLEKENFSYTHDHEMTDRLEQCDLLILDDLGTEYPKPFNKTAVYNLVNARLVREKPTIINTNLTLGEMKKNYTDRLVSRLVGDNHYMTFLGDDIRIMRKKRRS